MTLSENLARHRPTWFVGSGKCPAICAVDNDNDTCTTARPNEFMVVDLGFNSNATLHVIIIADDGYYIHTCARVCLSVINAISEKVSGSIYFLLTHWGRMTHICVNKLTIIGSDNGLSPDRRQAIIWTNAGILLIGTLGTNFSEILIEIRIFLFKKMGLNVSSGKWRH